MELELMGLVHLLQEGRIMKYIGWFVVFIWLTGAVGLIDVSVCIKAFGKCPQTTFWGLRHDF